ncbi:hypothetical protein ACSTLB_00005, partial [Vibrio parahaemolyticus]
GEGQDNKEGQGQKSEGQEIEEIEGQQIEAVAQGRVRRLAGAQALEMWCGRWDSNPHDVAVEGF